MATIEEMLTLSRQRAKERNLPYEGALLPSEAYVLLKSVPNAAVVDVRTRAEWDYVGRIPESVEIEWQTYPGGQPNAEFLDSLTKKLPKDALALFICRSGARSHAAAAAATSAGFAHCFNVLEGFEGDKDSQGHRNTVGGWRLAGLPWLQS
jgi:rhodanese-related sulfurtransferase